MPDSTQDAISFSHSEFKWNQPQQTPLTNKPKHAQQMPALEETPTFWPLKAHVSRNRNSILNCTQMPVSCLLIVDRLTEEVLYRPMRVADAVFSKTQFMEKASKLLKTCPGRGSRPIWKPIKANVLHNFSYVSAISLDLHDHNADHNIPDITIVSKTKIWAICKAESTNVFLFE